ncbi:Dual specificity protein phosphatase 14 [Blastocladiella emersonii ATCC 22665]|nr:Dual specificity protein phosphatase 14 [Blastocladiella emersonii ATCC 22665]
MIPTSAPDQPSTPPPAVPAAIVVVATDANDAHHHHTLQHARSLDDKEDGRHYGNRMLGAGATGPDGESLSISSLALEGLELTEPAVAGEPTITDGALVKSPPSSNSAVISPLGSCIVGPTSNTTLATAASSSKIATPAPGGPMTAEAMLQHLRRSYLQTVVLDVQNTETSTTGSSGQKRFLGAHLKRDFFKHRAFRWFSSSSTAVANSQANNAKIAYDVVFKTSSVSDRLGQLKEEPAIVLYDESGDREDVAIRLFRLLRMHKPDLAVYYLTGGISSFGSRYAKFLEIRPGLDGSSRNVSPTRGEEADGDNTAALLRRMQTSILQGRHHEPSLVETRGFQHVYKSKRLHPNLALSGASTPDGGSSVVSSQVLAPTSITLSETLAALAPVRDPAPHDGSLAPPPPVPLLAAVITPDGSEAKCLLATVDREAPVDHVGADPNEPFLYLSGIKGATEQYLRALKITHVLNVTQHPHPTNLPNVQYLRIALDDVPGARIEEHFETAVNFIENARMSPGTRVLVHCYAGVSRSASMILAYLIRYHNCTLLQAFDAVYRRRPVIQPNEGFARKLQRYEMHLRGTQYPSIAYGWLSASNAGYRDYIEFCENYDSWQLKIAQRQRSAETIANGPSRALSAPGTHGSPSSAPGSNASIYSSARSTLANSTTQMSGLTLSGIGTSAVSPASMDLRSINGMRSDALWNSALSSSSTSADFKRTGLPMAGSSTSTADIFGLRSTTGTSKGLKPTPTTELDPHTLPIMTFGHPGAAFLHHLQQRRAPDGAVLEGISAELESVPYEHSEPIVTDYVGARNLPQPLVTGFLDDTPELTAWTSRFTLPAADAADAHYDDDVVVDGREHTATTPVRPTTAPPSSLFTLPTATVIPTSFDPLAHRLRTDPLLDSAATDSLTHAEETRELLTDDQRLPWLARNNHIARAAEPGLRPPPPARREPFHSSREAWPVVAGESPDEEAESMGRIAQRMLANVDLGEWTLDPLPATSVLTSAPPSGTSMRTPSRPPSIIISAPEPVPDTPAWSYRMALAAASNGQRFGGMVTASGGFGGFRAPPMLGDEDDDPVFNPSSRTWSRSPLQSPIPVSYLPVEDCGGEGEPVRMPWSGVAPAGDVTVADLARRDPYGERVHWEDVVLVARAEDARNAEHLLQVLAPPASSSKRRMAGKGGVHAGQLAHLNAVMAAAKPEPIR